MAAEAIDVSATPLVSVVMGVRNEEASVRFSVGSVLLQQDVDLELLVVDDGSTDGTMEILDELAASDSRVRIVRSSGGLTRALIAGCREARGEMIARHDCGDWSLAGRLRDEAELLAANPEVGLVSCATEFVGPDGDLLYVSRGNCEAAGAVDIAPVSPGSERFVGPSHHGSVIFRRAAYEGAGGYREAFYYGQDWDLWYRIGARWKFQLIPDIRYRATVRAAGISLARKRDQQAYARLSLDGWRERGLGGTDADVMKKAETLRERLSFFPPTRAEESAAWYFLGECLRRNRNPRAVEYLRRAVRLDPRNWKAWARWAQAAVTR